MVLHPTSRVRESNSGKMEPTTMRTAGETSEGSRPLRNSERSLVFSFRFVVASRALQRSASSEKEV